MKTYGKLVRDRIPEIMRQKGEIPHISYLTEADYHTELDKKLDEEVCEYLESREPEELADILEVVYALCEAGGHTRDELETVRLKKRQERGGFQARIYLESKE